MLAIIDYGVGNLFSIKSSFARVGVDAVVTSDEKVIEDADRVILPGVGAFRDAANKLRETGLGEIVKEQVDEYHKYYDLIHYGDLYRLVSPFENPYRAAWQMVSQDKSNSLVTMVTMREELFANVILKLQGLDPEKYYQNDLTDEIYSGALLMKAGIVLADVAEGTGESIKIYFSEVK